MCEIYALCSTGGFGATDHVPFAGEIVERIMKGRAMYEERQRLKGEKGVTEEAEKRRQELEREQRRREVEGQFGL